MLSASQCRMARAALGIGVRELAEIADVSPNTIARLERGEALHSRTHNHIRGALEAEGVILIDNNTPSVLGGPGVRLGGSPDMSAMGKLFSAMWDASDAPATPEKTYNACLDLLDRYLTIIQTEGREPDRWERASLNDMLDALKSWDVHGAQVELWGAITPPDNQSADNLITDEEAAQAADFDLTYFRKCAAQLRARGFSKPERLT
ncbi:MAG: hypothetical protein QOJ54_3501 [Aliidongia sp.]|jgi:transcriptional regulator with XRE-family HTH domain|nr:hypothetical protein [Aliidongia sp.]